MFPIVSIFIKKNKKKNEWFNNEIAIAHKEKLEYFKLSKLDSGFKTMYKDKVKKFKKLVSKAKKEFYQTKINKSENKIKTTWAILNEQLGKRKLGNNVVKLDINGQEVTDGKTIANAFNRFFVDAPLKVTQQFSKKIGSKSRLANKKEKENANAAYTQFETTNANEVLDIVKKLPNKNSAGEDDLPASIIKSVVHKIMHVLVFLFNLF